MAADHTEQQSNQEQQDSRDLSLKSTRPPVDVPGYDAERLLGRGAYGEVWVGTDQNTSRRVAIKFFAHRSGVDWTTLSREVEKLVYLSADRYVVQLLDVGWDSDPPYYVMEYIENGSLDDLLQQHGPMAVGDAIDVFTEITIGLMHAHGKGVLHCDLKPANVLLDQDQKPRLADFGQSRLSHEQTPSFGTLFYMAPEQADLKSMPDARWDVYALGAMLYCMLVGSPPFRNAANLKQIEAADRLEERLSRYQRVIRQSPPPAEHRKVPGIDRALIEIIDRCLAVDPDGRFPNVQAVRDALNARELAKVRVPLMFLGFVGPVLLFIIMAMFGLRGYDDALSESEDFITKRARLSNDFAAKFAARSIEGEIARYFRVIRVESQKEELQGLFLSVAESDSVRQLNERDNSADDVEQLRPAFIADAGRQRLHDYLQQRLDSYLARLQYDPGELKLASMFAVDRQGRMLAVAYDKAGTVNRSVGWNYSYRTYFHGGPADLSDSRAKWQSAGPHAIKPIDDIHFSAAFQSTTTDIWKVAISTPLYQNDELVGVLALTVNLGDFAYLRTNYRPDRFAVLIDGRPGPNNGVILQHPLFDQRPATRKTGHFRLTEEQLQRVQADDSYRYHDPLAVADGGEDFDGEWIPAMEWVRMPYGSEDKEEMIVLIQEQYDKAIAPVHNLGSKLKREGIWALVGVISVALVLWYVVIRVLSEPRLTIRRGVTAGSSSTPVHNLTTLPGRRERPND
jgi:hypothetical protein